MLNVASIIHDKISIFSYYIIQGGGGAKVSAHTLGLLSLQCFIFETCNFADNIL